LSRRLRSAVRGSKSGSDRYRAQYVDLQFERGGLFELIHDAFHPAEVLYPGSAIHVTPAFYFPHVVFVDQDPGVAAFFAEREAILALINRNRRYRRTPYIQFIAQDFAEPLAVPGSRFDLVLALYTGGVSRTCSRYLRTGGILVTNDHQNDALDACRDGELQLVGVAESRRGTYRLREQGHSERLRCERAGLRTRRFLRRSSRGMEYVDTERYYVFRRRRSHPQTNLANQVLPRLQHTP
jgi:hypothetical protein